MSSHSDASTDHSPAVSLAPATPSRAVLLFLTILITSLVGVGVTLQFPTDDAGFTRAAVIADRDAFWLVLVVAAINLAVGIPALAIAGMRLASGRGSTLATVGGAVMWLGGGVYAAGVATWAGMFFTATDPDVLDPAVSTALIEAINANVVRLWATAGSGAALVALGTVLLSIGLLRARTLPRWVPIVAAISIVATFLLPTQGVVGLVTEGPVAVSSIAIGWYALRLSRTRAGATPAQAGATRLP
jgi:hypothetical protein